jgi:hypothetical protein
MFFYVSISCSAKPRWGKLPRRYLLCCALFLSGIAIIVIIHIFKLIVIIVIIVFLIRLLGLFKAVFLYRNGSNRLIMDTEKVHSIKHCHLDVTNYANPINCSGCCDGPEGGHGKWVHQQGLKTDRESTSAKTMMTHSLNKEASLLLCDVIRCRVEDRDATAEKREDSNGDYMPSDRFWKIASDCNIAADNEVPCMGIEINIWERVKVNIVVIVIIVILEVIDIIKYCYQVLYRSGAT